MTNYANTLAGMLLVLASACFVISTTGITPSHSSAGNRTAVSTGSPQESNSQMNELEVRISPLKSEIVAGEVLQLRVQVWNHGNEALYVCRDIHAGIIYGGPCHLRLDFNPLVKMEHRGGSSDCVPYELLRPAPQPTESIATILAEDWVFLPPNRFYVGFVTLDRGSYPELGVAGRYRIQGHYSSGGLLSSPCYYELKPFSGEVAELPGKSWQGEVVTNTASVRVKKTKS
jgi:hypothetical protein